MIKSILYILLEEFLHKQALNFLFKFNLFYLVNNKIQLSNHPLLLLETHLSIPGIVSLSAINLHYRGLQSYTLIKEFLVIIFLQLNNPMITENDLLKKLLVRVNMPTCRNIALSITRYLSQQQINDFCEAFRDNKSDYYWIQLMKTMRFINSYVNNSDRSLYFTFYDQEQYKKIEIQHIAAISQTHSQVFLCHQQQFEFTLALIKQKMPDVKSQFQMFKSTLTNPDLPMPKLKRETQGMFCNSPFQLFLVCSTFQEYDEEDLYTCFQQIKEYFSIEKQEKYLKQYMTLMKDKNSNNEMLKKIKKVRFTPYEITANNIKQFMVEDNQLHNMIVGLFALTDIMVKTTREYIQLINDPLHRLVQLILRYNIYRNYVLAVEDYLSFVFKMYDNIYKETIQEGVDRPNYRFWRAALSKWFLHMNELHRESEEVYMFCLTKLRNNKIRAQIQEKYSQDQQLLFKLLQAVQQSEFEYDLGCRILKGKSINLSEVGIFFDQHPQNYQIVVMEFNEYLVDISVNEQTVHWCGHTKQQMQQPYLDYEQYLINVSNEYFRKLIEQQTPLKKQEILAVTEIDLAYLSTLQIKNRTLLKLKQNMRKQYNLQENLAISAEFEEADKKLEYFNHKALILAEIDPNSRPFYSIPPYYSPDKIIDMLQETNVSSNNNSESEKIQYDSEDQIQVRIQNADKKPAIVKSYPKYHSDNEQEDVSKQLSLSKKQIKASKVFFQEEELGYLSTSAEYDHTHTVKEAQN